MSSDALEELALGTNNILARLARLRSIDHDHRCHDLCPGCGATSVILTTLQRAVAGERERCADIADQHASCEGIAQRIADEIRGQP